MDDQQKKEFDPKKDISMQPIEIGLKKGTSNTPDKAPIKCILLAFLIIISMGLGIAFGIIMNLQPREIACLSDDEIIWRRALPIDNVARDYAIYLQGRETLDLLRNMSYALEELESSLRVLLNTMQ